MHIVHVFLLVIVLDNCVQYSLVVSPTIQTSDSSSIHIIHIYNTISNMRSIRVEIYGMNLACVSWLGLVFDSLHYNIDWHVCCMVHSHVDWHSLCMCVQLVLLCIKCAIGIVSVYAYTVPTHVSLLAYILPYLYIYPVAVITYSTLIILVLLTVLSNYLTTP